MHPPLTKAISALPLMFFQLPDPGSFIHWDSTDEYAFGKEFMHAVEAKQEKVVFWARAMMVIFALLLALLVFEWARKLGGIRQGIFALFLFVFEPNIIAHSGLVTPDIGFTFSLFFSLLCLWNFINEPSFKNLAFTGFSLGLALLSKLSALILVPIFIVLIYAYYPRKKSSVFMKALLPIFLVTFFTLWSGYGFETGKMLADGAAHPTLNRLIVSCPKFLHNLIYFLTIHLTIPCPSFIKGLYFLIYCNVTKHESFLMGMHFRGGSLAGYLVAFLIKTPLPFLVFFVSTVFAKVKDRSLFGKNEVFLFFVPLAFFIFTAFFSIGLALKYVLPVYPLLCVFISQLAKAAFMRARFFRVAALALGAWLMAGTLAIYPHYLAYFNEFIGGPKNGYKYLVDSNLDWGQDLKFLKRYLTENNIQEIKLAYFGTADPGSYGIRYQKLEPFKHEKGVIVISATYLQGVHTPPEGYEWLKDYTPVATIGFSIFVYRIT
jgi:4-amino-4-deoxy-L-arabinose transferase-like glycosyltransferase